MSNSLTTTLNNLLSKVSLHEAILDTGSDPDSILNKWNEVVSFFKRNC